MTPVTESLAVIGASARTPNRQGWQLAAAQARGKSHEVGGEECQDAYRVCIANGKELIIAVADGAGSASLAEAGASLAAHRATEHLCSLLSESCEEPDESSQKAMLRRAMVCACEALEAEALVREVELHALATTLILVLATPKFVAVAQIGDGATVIADDHGHIVGLTAPPLTEYINEATFLTSVDALETMQMVFWHGRAERIAAFSDGLQLLSLQWPQRVPYEPFFWPLFEFISSTVDEVQATQQLTNFLMSEKVRSRTDDDVTLVLASSVDVPHAS